LLRARPLSLRGKHILISWPCLSLLAEGNDAHCKMSLQFQRFWRRDGPNFFSGGALLAMKHAASPLLEETRPKPECSKHLPSMRHHKYVG